MFHTEGFGREGLAVICWPEWRIKDAEDYGTPRKPAVPWTRERILNQYRGVEGNPWLDDTDGHIRLNSGLATSDQYEAVARYYEDVSKRHLCNLIYLQLPDISGAFPQPPAGFAFCGYDFGYYESEWNNYSVLFNEVVFGLYNELKAYAERLNEYLLLPSLDLAKDLERTRDQLIMTGAALEIDEKSVPIAIYIPLGQPNVT